jgi:tripeptide aminopeptidase
MTRFSGALLALSFILSSAPVLAAKPSAPTAAEALKSSAAFVKAGAYLDADHDRWVADIIALTEIPAPPFKEATRAKAYAAMFAELGLTDVEIDPEGNVLGVRKGIQPGPLLVVSAHLDTVFPEGTDVKVRREGTILRAPGVGDDSSGLATLLAMIRAMNAGNFKTKSDILFVGTVGEEGPGDLRGVRYLFNKGKYKGKIGAFFSFDGSGAGRVVDTGVGSKRYRAMFKGPGGHSYGAFGIVNPAAAMGKAIATFYETKVPTTPKTTFSVSVLGGGTSVNTIPPEVWMEVDMRSSDPAELAKLEKRFLTIIAEAAAEENKARLTNAGIVTVDPILIGDRPAGKTDPNSAFFANVRAAHAAFGVPVRASEGSTDSNVPMNLGIPALTVPGITIAPRAHAPDEWIDVEKGPNVELRKLMLATVLLSAGIAAP